MWIVQLALRRPYTFIVVALLIMITGPLMILRTPTDIFPNIDIPILSIVWSFNGFSADDMAHRITSPYERALTSDVDNIEHVESQTMNGVAVVKVFFHPGADINRAMAEASSSSQSILRLLPPGTLPPTILAYNASTVPILQLALVEQDSDRAGPLRPGQQFHPHPTGDGARFCSASAVRRQGPASDGGHQ